MKKSKKIVQRYDFVGLVGIFYGNLVCSSRFFLFWIGQNISALGGGLDFFWDKR
jgi:hypothetical protein